MEQTLKTADKLLHLWPEAGGDVLEIALIVLTVKALVGGGFLQRAEMADEGANLDIVKIFLMDVGGDDGATAIPRHPQLGILLMDVLRQLIDTPGIAVTTHESNASQVLAVFLYEVINGIRVQRQADIFPEVMTVTPRTVTRAIRDVNCQCHFVGYLLENNIRVDVFQHRHKNIRASYFLDRRT